jgi:hypothetical protein
MAEVERASYRWGGWVVSIRLGEVRGSGSRSIEGRITSSPDGRLEGGNGAILLRS